MVSFLAYDVFHIFCEFGVIQLISILTHDLDQESFEVGHMHAKGIDKHRELGAASAPDGIVIGHIVKIKTKLPDRNFIHWMWLAVDMSTHMHPLCDIGYRHLSLMAMACPIYPAIAVFATRYSTGNGPSSKVCSW